MVLFQLSYVTIISGHRWESNPRLKRVSVPLNDDPKIVHQPEFESGRTAYQTVVLTITSPVVNKCFRTVNCFNYP